MLGTVLVGVTAAFASCTVYGPDLLVGKAGVGASSSGGVGVGGGSSGGKLGSGGAAVDAGRNGVGLAGGAGSAGSSVAPDGGQAGEAGDAAGGHGGEANGSGGNGGSGGDGGDAGRASSGGRGGDAGRGAGGASGGSAGRAAAGAGMGGQGVGGVAGGAGASGGNTGAGMPGSAGSGETCPGCARLSVPLAATTDRTHFRVYLAANVDLSAATLVLRVRVASGTGGQIQAYVQHGGTPDYDLIYSGGRNLDTLAAWTDISWNVGTSVPSFDHTTVRRVGVEVLGGTSSSWTNPTLIDIDSITITGATPALSAFDFVDASTVSPGATSANNVLLIALDDDLVAGSALSWLGP